MFEPDLARSPGAPLLHGDKDESSRIAEAPRNVVAALHDGVGDLDRALADATAVVEGTWKTARVQHVALETHGCTASSDRFCVFC
ncbi:molybdopterin cofactor-binding domain-containing protein, partial [Klebsiella pneumoniae]|uniref:molybdopterin cofactor-binding domain-containing protein n=1 Tax=Klebsiella pneumoniae TaxID=573 RepID=UPI0039C29601